MVLTSTFLENVVVAVLFKCGLIDFARICCQTISFGFGVNRILIRQKVLF